MRIESGRKGEIMQARESICIDGRIWDLHIHSNQCGSSGKELKSLSIPEYIDELATLFENRPNLDMISFTDHNSISIDLYKEYNGRSGLPKLLPGIEIDISLSPASNAKHLIVYFDAVNDTERLKPLAASLNQYLADNKTGPSNPLDINSLLDRLLNVKVPFVLSPHAMKQGKRAIDSDWHSMDSSDRDTYKYVDQFFSFWETSGKSSIAHAVEFLRQMDCDERVSVVAFSDSKTIEGLKSYLDNPHQYFRSLPNFMGLRMVGSDASRIRPEQESISNYDLGKYLGRVEFSDSIIYLSPGLNAIVGGRGSGKSILLDSIANHLDCSKCAPLPEGRIKFLSGRSISIHNLAGDEIQSGSFSFDYFN